MDDKSFDEVEALDQTMKEPSEARIYDYLLGGASNFAVDREFAERQIARIPTMRLIARENRRFLRRAVRFQLDQGIRQFLDVGSGIPTVGNVHQIAEHYAPGEATVVYVDRDPIAERHARSLLTRDGDPKRHTVLCADLLDPGLWQRVRDTGLIDLTKPVGLLLVAVVHFITPDRKPDEAVGFLRDQLAPGSYLAFSHVTSDGLPPEQRALVEAVQADYANRSASSGWLRSRTEIATFFGDWTLEDPGLVWTCEWRREPDEPPFSSDPADARFFAGVARKP